MIKEALQDFNIEIVTLDKFDVVPSHTAQLWSWMDSLKSQNAAAELQYLEGCSGSIYLPFEVRYQLEACISWGILNEHNITKNFLIKLAELASENPSKARTILEYVMEQDRRIYDPMTIFDDEEAFSYSPKTDIPSYCAYARKATITPTRIYLNSPTVESTNRVLRHYAREHKDGRLLRVQFTDEMSQVRELLILILFQPNSYRVGSIRVRIRKETTNSLLVSSELLSMESKLEIAFMSFWHLVMPSSARTERISFALPTIFPVMTSANGWAISPILALLQSMLQDLANVFRRQGQSMG